MGSKRDGPTQVGTDPGPGSKGRVLAGPLGAEPGRPAGPSQTGRRRPSRRDAGTEVSGAGAEPEPVASGGPKRCPVAGGQTVHRRQRDDRAPVGGPVLESER